MKVKERGGGGIKGYLFANLFLRFILLRAFWLLFRSARFSVRRNHFRFGLLLEFLVSSLEKKERINALYTTLVTGKV